MAKSFLPAFLGGSGSGTSSALAALQERAAHATALADTLTGQVAALTTERDTLQASLTESATKAAALQASLTESETALAASRTALAALEAEVPEKVKAAAIAMVAAGGIPAGETPPANPGEAKAEGRPLMTMEEYAALDPRKKTEFGKAGGRFKN